MPTPRLAYEDLPAPLREQLKGRVAYLGHLGEFFQVAALQPEALGHFLAYTDALKAALPLRLTEIVTLTVAAETENEYELGMRERLGLPTELDPAEVRALVTGDVHSVQSFSPTDIAAADLARAVAGARGRSCHEPYERLEGLETPALAVGCLMLATRFLAHGTMANTWSLLSPARPAAPAAVTES
jgi:hypothetical protein